MQDEKALALFGALSQPTRLQMVKALVRAGPDGMTAGAVAQAVGAAPSRASFHLSTLADVGLVTAERQAREITYRVQFATFAGLVTYVLEDCCGGDAEMRACCSALLPRGQARGSNAC